MRSVRPAPISAFLFLFLALIGTAGCRRDDPATAGVPLVRVWCHQGQEAENQAMRAIAAAFNAAHAGRARVELTFFPDFQYNEKIAIAAAARDLPDALDLDGPLVARYVDAGLLAPLDAWFTPAELADFLPTIRTQGTIDGRLYALGAFDSAVVLYYDRELLAAAGVEPPPAGRGWTWNEFLAACEKLHASGVEPVAFHMNESADEWFTYAFSPVIWSNGGQLISSDGTSVRGVLASVENIAALQAWQAVFKNNYAATDPVDPDPFGSGRTAMDWSGHWMAPSHVRTKGAALGAMPLPRVGARSVAPCGSWCWGVSAQARHPELAALWLKWVTDPQHGIAPIVRANGAVPARRSALALFPEYQNLPYRLFREQLETSAQPRPRTPFYATLTQRFAGALRDIARGDEVAGRLQAAEREVQAVIDRRRPAAAPAAVSFSP
ncbi:MAG TPA: sugar ABC transporter substrate-binding protein [Opitutus sp.]|nr:sugar ABC transporter substrate-binding protein [Opitutus sp.]